MKKIRQRTCIGCNLKKDKSEFLRIVLDKKGHIFIDEKGNAQGRGAYICDSIECMDKALKLKRIEKSFNIKIDENLRNRIRGVIIERKSEGKFNQ